MYLNKVLTTAETKELHFKPVEHSWNQILRDDTLSKVIKNERIISPLLLCENILTLTSNHAPDRKLLALFYQNELYFHLFMAFTSHIPIRYSMIDMLHPESRQNRGPYRYVNFFSVNRSDHIKIEEIENLRPMLYFLKQVKEYLAEKWMELNLAEDYELRTFSPMFEFMNFVRKNLERYRQSPEDQDNPLKKSIETTPDSPRMEIGNHLRVNQPPSLHWRNQSDVIRKIVLGFLIKAARIYLNDGLIAHENDRAYRTHAVQNGAQPLKTLYINYDLNPEVPFGTSYGYPR